MKGIYGLHQVTFSYIFSVCTRYFFRVYAPFSGPTNLRKLPEKFPVPGGHKITSASSLGGYGNAGGWGIVRCIDDDLDELLRRHGITEHRAADLLEEGTGEKWWPKLKPQRSKLTKLVN